ncbi:cell division protein ZapD [Colwellia sp. UCD-KL20]|uniref:cell division protein ZapD n=1 Tax=Colwellia sp. UCD-KL20 TaxID=1917165 RepID=UPI000970D975|nr:cell division protein ZapD [Colwellia sp. UCD-KL20]
MSSVLFEHPLNERIRNYLKLEQLFKHLEMSSSSNICSSHITYFNALFSIIDTLERNDIRGDLIKELEKLEQSLVVWSQAPDIDTSLLEENLKQTITLLCELKKTKQQWLDYREIKFLTGLKQRFAMQGGTCVFDLPQLHFWLSREEPMLVAEMKSWINLFSSISLSLCLTLKFIRLKGEFENIETDNGFYQDNGENLLLLRIKTPNNANFYPTVSGNKFRYSIRFVVPCNEMGRRYLNQPTNFELAKC